MKILFKRPNRPSQIRPFLFLLLFSICISGYSSASPSFKRFAGFPENLWGFGFDLGEPTAARAQYFLDWKHALNLKVGYSLAKVIVANANYLFYGYNANDKVISKDFWNSLLFYGGGGPSFGVGLLGSDASDGFQIGLQLVGGAEYIFAGSSWSVHAEISPEYLIQGHSNFNFGISVGLTYYLFDSAKPTRRDFSKKQSAPKPVIKKTNDAEFDEDESEFK